MAGKFVCVAILFFKCFPTTGLFLVVPEDVGTGFAAIYGFTPRIVFGQDHRFGFGFRFGNHADLQIMYEFGPQTSTKPLQPIRTRSTYRQRVTRRRPLLDFLLRTGIIKETSYQYDVVHELDEPRR